MTRSQGAETRGRGTKGRAAVAEFEGVEAGRPEQTGLIRGQVGLVKRCVDRAPGEALVAQCVVEAEPGNPFPLATSWS